MTVADRIANTALGYLTDRKTAACGGHDGEWRNPDVLRAFVATLRIITVTADHAGQVTATAPPTREGRVWAYAGGDALRAARRTVGVTGTVARLDDRTFVLTFDPDQFL